MPRTKTLARPVSSVASASVLTGSQIRAARALLKWSGRELAERCGVSYPALQRAEAVDDVPNMQVRNLMAIKQALEAGGVAFLDAGENRDGGAGVRLK